MFRCLHLLTRRSLRSIPHNDKRSYATSSPYQFPPLLRKFREDLKISMRAKDATRLDVVRGLLNEVNGASKPPNKPITTDIQILAIVRRRLAASKHAAEQFATGGRPDLKEKEDGQVGVLEDYAAAVETISEEEVRTRVEELVNQISGSQISENRTINKGAVIKRLLGPGGVFDGKPVEAKNVVKIVDMAVRPPQG